MSVTLPEAILLVTLGSVAYSYVVYPILLFLLAAIRQTARDLRFVLGRRSRRTRMGDEFQPRVTLVLAAYNEEGVIEEKIRNMLSLTYPASLLEVLIGLDAPTDSTASRVMRLAPADRIHVIHFPQRRGKLEVLNELVQRSTGEIVVTTDANTLLEPDALQKLVRHFANPRVGAVCTEVDVTDPSGNVRNESLYWRYEVALKFLENRLGCVLGGTGGFYAFRRVLFTRVHSIIEDFVIVMNILYAGYVVVYDPECRSSEPAAPTLQAEFSRKVRIAAGCFQAFFGNPRYLNPLRGFPAFAYFSHKVLRWFAPLFLISAFIVNLFLLSAPVYAALMVAQLGFYSLAALAYMLTKRGGSAGPLSPVLYFVTMNVAFLIGLFRFLTGSQKTVWAATPRSAPAPVSPPREGSNE